MKKFYVIGLMIFLIVVVGLFGGILPDNRVEVVLDECVDGDTAWFLIEGKREKVRFLAIDTPESVHPEKEVEDYGMEASDYTCQVLTEANHIYLEYDLESDQYDKYERVLAWVFVDEINLSELLVENGYARVHYIYGNYRYLDTLCEKQENAYQEKIGIWKEEFKYSDEDNYCMTRG